MDRLSRLVVSFAALIAAFAWLIGSAQPANAQEVTSAACMARPVTALRAQDRAEEITAWMNAQITSGRTSFIDVRFHSAGGSSAPTLCAW